ncbi:ABC transporter ATP-binding protein [Leadbettera azotonutricia]|uniref:Hemin import ATP-binding protein HmuV n=1 Tax=Leadbettera azotonutricia (strain ATCC BAA-888 / DSM 13862 / ZAS-9) TaxID=545695 RepID=F5YEP8_LEAAZ|nr:ABC transporter ATP-binding protein [Leadbettera azotonutricia]AEF80614.1 hemin import ATP-binding protein HmuV [Leadbettera azotonutricia ZAS-9]
MNSKKLEVQNLSFAYGPRTILRDLNFYVGKGELMAMLGPNGAGKSTLFRCIMGFEKNFEGQVLLSGENIRGKSPEALAKNIAYVPQSHHPGFNYSAFDMTLMGTAAMEKEWVQPGKKQTKAAADALKQLGIYEFRDRGFRLLSGGEQQLVLIARALAQQAEILIMDEPTANLDYGNQFRVLFKIQELCRQGYSIMYSTHNPNHAFMFAHKALVLHESRIAALGTPEEVLTEELIHRLYGVPVLIHRDSLGNLSCSPCNNSGL